MKMIKSPEKEKLKRKDMDNDRYKKWLKHFKAEIAKSEALPDGLQVGKIFGIPVADGAAHYEITKINKRTVRVKWREDLSLDDYKDMICGDIATIPKDRIEVTVRLDDAMREIPTKQE